MARVTVRIPPEAMQQPVAPPVQQAVEPDIPPAAPKKPRQPRQPIDKRYLLVGAGLLVLAILVFVLINDRRHLKQEVNKLSSDSQTTGSKAGEEGKKYQDAVAKLIEVPAGITPLANTPSQEELTKLQADNPIYSRVQVGDVFLIYTQPDKSLFLVVYRPGTQKIVLATAGSQQSASTPTSAPSTAAPAATTPATKTNKP